VDRTLHTHGRRQVPQVRPPLSPYRKKRRRQNTDKMEVSPSQGLSSDRTIRRRKKKTACDL